MTASTKALIAVVAVVVAGAIGGTALYIHSLQVEIASMQAQFGSTSGATFNSAKIAAQVILNPSSTTTIYSVLNSDASNRFITEADVHLTGATGTTSSSAIQCATSSTQYFPPTNSNFILSWNATSTASTTFSGGSNLAGYSTVGVGTTTGDGIFMASSSPGLSGVIAGGQLASSSVRIWPTNTYLVCQATNTDTNNKVFNPTTTGFIGFRYFAE